MSLQTTFRVILHELLLIFSNKLQIKNTNIKLPNTGMVFMSSSVLTWEPILKGWLQNIPPQQSELLLNLYESIFQVTKKFKLSKSCIS